MTLPDFITQDADGFIHLTGHRIGLHQLIRLYNDGYSPEMLVEYFPTLSLALIHKTIAFYLENQTEMDAYAEAQQALVADQAAAAPKGPSRAELRARMQAIGRAKAR